MKKSLFVLILLCTATLSVVYADTVQKNLSDNLLRMHIIADSNSSIDQQAKLAVRDKILSTISSSSNIGEIADIASRELSRLGMSYTADASIEQCYVPQKDYKNLRLPEGFYNCVRVVLGSGSGENWWCVAYPPLCFSEDVFGSLSSDGYHKLEDMLDSETLKSIIDSGGINYRFKLVETVKSLENRIKSSL